MPVQLAIFEFIGTTEMLVIAFVALIIFGPRKLPEIGRSIGKSLAEFRRASEDFKRTWEREVEFERIEREMRVSDAGGEARPALSGDSATGGVPDGVRQEAGGREEQGAAAELVSEEHTIARTQVTDAPARAEAGGASDSAQADSAEPARKHDWL